MCKPVETGRFPVKVGELAFEPVTGKEPVKACKSVCGPVTGVVPVNAGEPVWKPVKTGLEPVNVERLVLKTGCSVDVSLSERV